MRRVNLNCYFLLAICNIVLAGCNSGGAVDNQNTQTNTVSISSQALTNNSPLVLSDVNTAIHYRDSLEDIPVGTFGLKRVLVVNNSSQILYNLKLPTSLPSNITYDDTRTTCLLNDTQKLATQESCVMVFKYLPKVEGESSSFNIMVNAVDENKAQILSNTKNIPYSSRITHSPQIKFSTEKMATIGGMSENIVLNYTGPLITEQIKVDLSTSNTALNISTNSCIFDKINNTCTFQAKLERNKSGTFEIYANAPNFPKTSLSLNAKPIDCTLIDDVQKSPYELPLGFQLRQNECIMVADQGNNIVSILKLTNNFVPEFNIIPCDIRNDAECNQSIWVPLQGMGFDNYLADKNQNALDLCLTQSYYNPKMIGIPNSPTLRFSILNHGPNKGKLSLSETSIAYLGADLVLWDSLTYTHAATARNSIYISTDDDYSNSFYMLSDDKKTKLWDINYSTYNFSDQDLSTGKDLCQFYTQWQ